MRPPPPAHPPLPKRQPPQHPNPKIPSMWSTEPGPTSKAMLSKSHPSYVPTGTSTHPQGHAVDSAPLHGAPTAIAMIFTRCGHACPTMVANMKEAHTTLPANLRDRVQWLLITFDIEHDTPEVLARYAQSQRLNDQWILLHGSEAQVRMISKIGR